MANPGPGRRFYGGRLGSPFASLSVKNFRYLWIGQVCSATGMHADMLARSWLVWELTGSFTAVAGVNVARGVPYAGLRPVWRGDRRPVQSPKGPLWLLQTWTMLMHAVMAALVISGHVELWHIYALAALLGISMSMNQPVRTSIIPELVGKDRMLNAITLNSMAINGTRFIGPAAVAFLIGWQGVGAAYIVSTGMYMMVVMATLKHTAGFLSSRSPEPATWSPSYSRDSVTWRATGCC